MTYTILTSQKAQLTANEIVTFYQKVFPHFNWQESSVEEQLKDKHHFFLGLYLEKQLIGLISLSYLFETGEILNFGILPDYRRQGLGEKLIESSIKLLCQQKVETILLEVRKSNTPARRLYEKFGFKEISLRKHYYHHPTEDAVIYQKNLQNV